ncbi:MAG TPA: recombinase family protein [Bacteriovoracaceae bacterium]|nr:recombinase family protein [Bacteriovoracaceae bacterium]
METKIKAVAYARVSTLLGQDPENQLVRIREFSASRGFDLISEYVDKGISGSTEKRPSLDQLILDARMGKFKVLVVSGIDRIGRNTRHLLNLIHELSGYGVSLISLRESLDFTTPMGQAALTILGAMAQLEKELIRERIRTALAVKKLSAQQLGRDWRCGRPEAATETLKAQIISLSNLGLSIRAIERKLEGKISRTTIQRVLKKNAVSKP